MPVLLPRPYEDKAAIKRWQDNARRAYPPGWFERGGPVLTRRDQPLNRHVPGGGYDLARSGTAGHSKATPVEGYAQESLFDAPTA